MPRPFSVDIKEEIYHHIERSFGKFIQLIRVSDFKSVENCLNTSQVGFIDTEKTQPYNRIIAHINHDSNILPGLAKGFQKTKTFLHTQTR